VILGRTVRAFAPGGIGNIGPGLDILGCAVTGPGDAVIATSIDTPGVRIDDPGHPELPRDPALHACGIAALEVLRRAGDASAGVALRVTKGLPLAGGQGGSAASAVAGAVAVNALLDVPLSQSDLLFAALVAEERLAGRHIDNLAPALVGGILLIRSIEPLDFIRLPAPPTLRIVLVHPSMRLRTADARAVLPSSVDLKVALAQAAAVSTMVAAFLTGELRYLRGAIDDRIAEPARAALLPGFVDAKRAALDSGALGCSISGGGPSSFALTEGDDAAESVRRAMIAAYEKCGIEADGRIAEIDERGARVDELSPTQQAPA
jgi:homoserine kinase